MDLRQLAYVVAIVDHGGFTRAAEALHVAQPSLSQSVASLERELGVALFDRIGRHVQLTAAGRALLPGARQALHDVEVARAAVDEVRGVAGGRLDLVSIPTLGVSPVAQLIGEFRAEHPDVTVRLVEPDDPAAVAAEIRTGASEIGFTELPVEGAGIVSTELDRQQYVAVYHRSVARGRRISLDALASLPLITTPRGTSTRRLIDEAFDQVGRVPRIAVETDLREVIAAIVQAGGGYSILPRPVAERLAADDVLVADVMPRITRRVGVIRRPGALSPAGEAFLRFVVGDDADRD